MPLPSPGKSESQDEFIARCMGNDTMKEEYPDNKQRLAVCFSQWRDKDKKSVTPYLQRRFIPASEFRIVEEDKKPKIVGYASVFNVFSQDMWGFKERVAPGAFSESLKRQDDVRMLFNHDPNFVIARTANGTLKLREDDKGLYFEGTPADTQWEKDLLTKIKRGDISQNSFGFTIDGEEWDKSEKIRTLTKVTLYDVSPVTYPAYKQTELSVRWQFGETTFPVNLADKEIEELVKREDEDPMVLANRYGLSHNIYSAGPLNPTAYTVTGKEGEAKSTVLPKPDEHFIDPSQWAKVQSILNRRK